MDIITFTAENARESQRESQIRAHAETVQQAIIRAAVANMSETTQPNLNTEEIDALRDNGYSVEPATRGWKISWTQK